MEPSSRLMRRALTAAARSAKATCATCAAGRSTAISIVTVWRSGRRLWRSNSGPPCPMDGCDSHEDALRLLPRETRPLGSPLLAYAILLLGLCAGLRAAVG